MTPPRRSASGRRLLLAAGAMALTLGILSVSAPAGAAPGTGWSTEATPTPPADQAPIDPPTSPAPPVDPAPSPLPTEAVPPPSAPTTEPEAPIPEVPIPGVPIPAVPIPALPMPTPVTSPSPTDEPRPVPAPVPVDPSGAIPFLSGTPVVISDTVPAALGRVYPTNPWIYNGLPGTRYLDERERSGDSVTRRHMGIDAQGGFRQPIFAVADGVVVDGTWGTTRRDRHGYGNQIEIAHADGYATRYAHFAEAPVVQLGDRVLAGQLIGYMGGSQYGVLDALDRHLHFEVTLDGRNVDPLAFLGAASAGVAEAAAAQAAATAPSVAGSQQLFEIRPKPDGGYASEATGLVVDSNVFTAVDMGAGTAQVLVSEGGTLKLLAVVDGAWTETDTQLQLHATSIAGADTDGGFPEAFAVEDGKLFHIAGGPGGWTKTWTGHSFAGTVSAVRMPGDRLHGMLQQSGHLYHLHPAEGGLWNITDTRTDVGAQIDAVYAGGRAPEVLTVIDGQVQRVVKGELGWGSLTTGLPASASLAGVLDDAGWPVAVTADVASIGMTLVVGQTWTRYTYGVGAPGPIDAIDVAGVGPVIYTIG